MVNGTRNRVVDKTEWLGCNLPTFPFDHDVVVRGSFVIFIVLIEWSGM